MAPHNNTAPITSKLHDSSFSKYTDVSPPPPKKRTQNSPIRPNSSVTPHTKPLQRSWVHFENFSAQIRGVKGPKSQNICTTPICARARPNSERDSEVNGGRKFSCVTLDFEDQGKLQNMGKQFISLPKPSLSDQVVQVETAARSCPESPGNQPWFGHNGDRKLWDGQLPVIKPLYNPTASYKWEAASSDEGLHLHSAVKVHCNRQGSGHGTDVVTSNGTLQGRAANTAGQ
ncbi:hypothetical protein Bbelb_314900 [Branchiostoma belcheri]|nr:hypothetical protein Bbelb_314900 [Branchiostoma belcheri]